MTPQPAPAGAPSRAALVAAFAAIYLIWGSTYLGIRIAVETLPPFLLSGFRFAVAGGILFGVLRLRGAPMPTAAQWRDHAFVGTCLLLGGNAVVSWAEERVPSGMTALLLGASPLTLVLLDWMRPGGRRPRPAVWIGVGVGIAGLALLLGPGALPGADRPPVARVAALGFSSVVWWIGSLYGKHCKSGADPMMGAAIQMLCGSAIICAVGLLLGEGSRLHPSLVSARSGWAFVYLVIAGSLVAYPIYVWLLKHSPPAVVSTYSYVNPVVAVVLGWAVLGEPLTLRTLVATGVIVAAVVIITVQREAAPRGAPVSAAR